MVEHIENHIIKSIILVISMIQRQLPGPHFCTSYSEQIRINLKILFQLYWFCLYVLYKEGHHFYLTHKFYKGKYYLNLPEKYSLFQKSSLPPAPLQLFWFFHTYIGYLYEPSYSTGNCVVWKCGYVDS